MQIVARLVYICVLQYDRSTMQHTQYHWWRCMLSRDKVKKFTYGRVDPFVMTVKLFPPKFDSANFFSGVEFGSTEYVITPGPIPSCPSMICSQSAPLVAVHSQPGWVITLTEPNPPMCFIAITKAAHSCKLRAERERKCR